MNRRNFLLGSAAVAVAGAAGLRAPEPSVTWVRSAPPVPPLREILTENKDFYVGYMGDRASFRLVPSSVFKADDVAHFRKILDAIDYVVNEVDCNGHQIKIVIGPGVHEAPWVKGLTE